MKKKKKQSINIRFKIRPPQGYIIGIYCRGSEDKTLWDVWDESEAFARAGQWDKVENINIIAVSPKYKEHIVVDKCAFDKDVAILLNCPIYLQSYFDSYENRFSGNGNESVFYINKEKELVCRRVEGLVTPEQETKEGTWNGNELREIITTIQNNNSWFVEKRLKPDGTFTEKEIIFNTPTATRTVVVDKSSFYTMPTDGSEKELISEYVNSSSTEGDKFVYSLSPFGGMYFHTYIPVASSFDRATFKSEMKDKDGQQSLVGYTPPYLKFSSLIDGYTIPLKQATVTLRFNGINAFIIYVNEASKIKLYDVIMVNGENAMVIGVETIFPPELGSAPYDRLFLDSPVTGLPGQSVIVTDSYSPIAKQFYFSGENTIGVGRPGLVAGVSHVMKANDSDTFLITAFDKALIWKEGQEYLLPNEYSFNINGFTYPVEIMRRPESTSIESEIPRIANYCRYFSAPYMFLHWTSEEGEKSNALLAYPWGQEPAYMCSTWFGEYIYKIRVDEFTDGTFLLEELIKNNYASYLLETLGKQLKGDLKVFHTETTSLWVEKYKVQLNENEKTARINYLERFRVPFKTPMKKSLLVDWDSPISDVEQLRGECFNKLKAIMFVPET
jgi:hypothetical protein